MFEFYSEVKIKPTRRLPQYGGMSGVVVGVGEDEGNGATYAVAFMPTGVVVSFWERELEATGVKYSRADIYDGDVIRVRVDSDGNGSIS